MLYPVELQTHFFRQDLQIQRLQVRAQACPCDSKVDPHEEGARNVFPASPEPK